ncbi:hypothetical protein SCUP234_10256 [Seiridium cupressi]
MFIPRLLVAPFSLVFAGVLQATLVLPRDDDNEADLSIVGSTTLVKAGEGSAPTAGEPADSIGTNKPTNAPIIAPPELSLGPTPSPPGPLTALATKSIPTLSKSTSATTLVVTTTPSATSISTATFGTFSTVVSLPPFTSPVETQSSITSIGSPVPTDTAWTSDISLSTSDTPTSISPFTPSSTNTMSQTSGSKGGSNDRTLIITLSSVLSVVGLVIIAVSLYLCLRNRRRRAKLFNRGVTPIDDDEIATWKVNRTGNEKGGDRFTSRNSVTSNYTHRKAPSNSVIQYQSQIRPSIEISPRSPRSFTQKQSFEVPQTPQTAVLAVAPNARSGLTDETVPGDEPFVASPRRQASKKLYKAPPNSPPIGHRPRVSRGSRSSSVRSFADAWYGDNTAISPRTSNDFHSANRVPSRVYSTSTAPPRLSFGEAGPFVSLSDNEPLTTVLSPPPLHRTEIGRAIG